MVNWDNLKNDPLRDKLYTPNGLAYEWTKTLFEEKGSTSMTQLRNIMNAMEAISKRIKDDASTTFEIQRLYPLLANMRAKKGGGKENRPITQEFHKKFISELGNIKTKEGFKEFFEFYKAIVQFHAYEQKLRKEK